MEPFAQIAVALRRFNKRVLITVVSLALLAIFITCWAAISHYQASKTLDLVTLARNVRRAVVLIEVFDNDGNLIKTGSGFFVSDNGLLITNAHVIKNAASAAAKTASGDVLPIKGAIRVERENDLAVLAVEGRNLPFLTLGQSEFLQTGDHVAVIGSPLGLEGSLSEGIIAAKRKETDADRQWLQITAPISPGSSGSPVLDSTGKVIGIATLVLQGGQSVNFAAPVELAVAMLRTKDKSKVDSSAPIPLEEIDRVSGLDNGAVEKAVFESAEYQQLEKAMAAPIGDAGDRYEQADWPNLLRVAKALVAKYPDSSLAYTKLASVYEQMGSSDDAIAAYQHALKLQPEDAGSWHLLALIYKHSGKITQAEFAFSQAIAYQTKLMEQPSSSRLVRNASLWMLGTMYRDAGDIDAAKQIESPLASAFTIRSRMANRQSFAL
jgi:S1-C subfamily serine protease